MTCFVPKGWYLQLRSGSILGSDNTVPSVLNDRYMYKLKCSFFKNNS